VRHRLAAVVAAGAALLAACSSSAPSLAPPPPPTPTTTETADAATPSTSADVDEVETAAGTVVPAPEPLPQPEPGEWILFEPSVVGSYPHDDDAFTQGLLLDGERLFESTGRYGASELREVDLESGAVERSIDLDDRFFGEGLALVGDRLIVLTWQEETALVHDRDTFELLGAFEYSTEGWGLCHDGDQLIMSDGSNELVTRDPATFEATGSVRVTLDDQPIRRLNELECVGGDVWANVWLTDTIVRIDPATGNVTGVVDASALEPDRPEDTDAVLNGIAYDETTGRFLLTGKLWNTVYEVDLVEVPRS